MKIDLQVHTFFENYGLEDVINAMTRNSIDMAALLKYNEDYYPEILKASIQLPSHFKIEEDELLIRIKDTRTESEKYFIRGIEVKTDDKFHFIVIGYKGVPIHRTSKETIDNVLENNAFVYFDHPYVNCDDLRKDITDEQEDLLELLCHIYQEKIALEWSAYCNPGLRKFLGGTDVNEKAIHLSTLLHQLGHNVPVVADSDVHARKKWLLNALGTAYVKTDLDLTSGRAAVNSLTNNIFNGNYENYRDYVSLSHFIDALAIPFVLNLYRNRS